MPKIEEITDLDLLQRMGNAACLHSIRVLKEISQLKTNGLHIDPKLLEKGEDLTNDIKQVTDQLKKLKEKAKVLQKGPEE